MANKVTQDDIIKINQAYLQYKTYAGAARATGFSASTVKKYIISDFIDPATMTVEAFTKQSPIIVQIDWDFATILTLEELQDLGNLRKEIAI